MRAFIKSLHYSISDNTKLYFLNISITNILLEFIKISYKHQDVVYKDIYIYISLLKCYIRTIKINAVVKMYSLNSDHFDFQNKHLFFLFSSSKSYDISCCNDIGIKRLLLRMFSESQLDWKYRICVWSRPNNNNCGILLKYRSIRVCQRKKNM